MDHSTALDSNYNNNRRDDILVEPPTDLAVLGEAAFKVQAIENTQQLQQQQEKQRQRQEAPLQNKRKLPTPPPPPVPETADTTARPPPANDTTTTKKPAAKKARTNWAVGASKAQLEQAVQEWDSHTGRALHPTTGQRRALKEYAELVQIPYHTFRKYVAKQRRIIGQPLGRQPLLDSQEQEWMAQKFVTLRREGLLAQEAVQLVLERHPELTRAQALRHIHRTLLKHNTVQLKVPPKRGYHKRSSQKNASTTIEQEESDEEEEEEDDDEEDDEEEDEEGGESTTVNSNADDEEEEDDSEESDESEESDDEEEESQLEGEEEETKQEKAATTHVATAVDPRTGTTITGTNSTPVDPVRKHHQQQQLAAIDARIAKLRSDLLDAELEKEKILRGMQTYGRYEIAERK